MGLATLVAQCLLRMGALVLNGVGVGRGSRVLSGLNGYVRQTIRKVAKDPYRSVIVAISLENKGEERRHRKETGKGVSWRLG